MVFVIVLIVTALAILYYIATKHYTFWEKYGIKCITPPTIQGAIKGTLLVGDDIMYTCHPGEPYVGIIRLHSLAICVRDPHLAKLVLAKDFSHFQDRGMRFNEKRDILSNHLFNLEGKKWKSLRAKLTPTFTSGRLRAMFPLIKYCMDEMTSIVSTHAGKPEAVDVQGVLAQCTTDVILSCAFGLQGNCLKDGNDIYLRMVKAAFRSSKLKRLEHFFFLTFPSLEQYFPPLPETRRTNEFFRKSFQETLRQRKKSGQKRNDFLDLLMEIQKNGKLADGVADEDEPDSSFELTFDLMVAQAFVFFVAGSETSSSTSSFVVVELANNKPIQDKLRAEIDESIKRHGGLTYDAVMGMTYLDQVVTETLRKYPVVPALVRKVTKHYTMPDRRVTLPEGMRVYVHIKGIQNDPKYYPDPEKFDPERFSPDAKHDRNKFLWLPFGEGPRICIGMRFGLLQVKLAIASLISQFELDPEPGIPYPPVLSKKSALTKLEHGAQVLITRRISQ